MSLNFMIEDENQPVIWRSPVIAGVVKQFWNDVFWGELDYLIIDMPPGNGDVVNCNAVYSYKWTCNGICTTRFSFTDCF